MKKNPNIRAIHLCSSFSPSYFPLMILNSFFRNISPYYNLYLSAEIINEIAGKKNTATLLFLIGITVVGNLFISIIGGWISRCLSHSKIILSQAESRYYMHKVFSMDYSDFENPDVRQLRRKITESSKINSRGIQLLLKSVQRIINSGLSTIIAVCLSVELFVKSSSIASWQFTLSFFIIITGLMTAYIIYNFKIQDKNAAAMDKVSQAMVDNNRVDNAIDCYNMGKDIRLYCQDSIIMKIKQRSLISHRKAFEAFSLYQLKSGVPVLVLTNLLNIAVYIFVIINSAMGAFGVGSIIKYVGLAQKLVECILEIFRGFTDIKTNTRFVKDYLAYFDIPCTLQSGTQSIQSNESNEAIPKYTIEFRGVSFKYPLSEIYALKNINMRITFGERIGIVGQNGSGKTTFIKLLCRLYDPTEGEILLNGMNIKEYDYHEYLSILSVVFQDFKLFSFSLAQNVSANECYNKARVEKCLFETGFDKSLKKIENGIEMCLYKDFDKNGIEISGGEAQKIALARALYKDSPIIILDEPTAALDPIAEAEVYSRFDEMVGEKTVIYISHRLSSCRCCDIIVVFDNGEIVQTGNHAELVANKCGKYYELWSAQAQYYTEQMEYC